MKRISPLDQPSYCDLWMQYVMKRISPLDQPSYCDLWMQYVMKRFSPLDQPSYCDLWMQYVMKRISDETSKWLLKQGWGVGTKWEDVMPGGVGPK